MDEGTRNQIYRLNDLLEFVKDKSDVNSSTSFLKKRLGRSPSSLEEELVSSLPLFDDEEEQEISMKAQDIALKNGTSFPNQKAFDIVLNEDVKLGKNVKAIGLMNFQKLLQVEFYKNAFDLLSLSKSYEFPAKYESLTPLMLGNINAACLEKFNYSGSVSYRSVLYHLMRHLTNINGSESKSDIEQLAKQTFDGKKVLELGCGPGFFLYTLRELGADVTGVEFNNQFKDQTKEAGLNIIYGDAKNFKADNKYDIVFSKDFLCLAVTKENANPIMKRVYSALQPGGLTLHQIDYGKTSEERYFAMVEQAFKQCGASADAIKETWFRLDGQQKEMMLRKNILNISLESLQDIGFNPLTSYRYDVDNFLTITLKK